MMVNRQSRPGSYAPGLNRSRLPAFWSEGEPMIRLFTLVTLISSGLAFAQHQPPGDVQGQPDAHQQCQMKCGQNMSQCMMPCTGGNPGEASKPENRSKTMAC